MFFAELTALSIKRQELTVAPTWLILSKVYCCILFSVCKEAHVNILSWYKLSRRVLLQNAELFVLVQWFLNQGAWKVYKGGASIWQRHIIEKQDNAKLMLFCFLYLIWRSGEARVTIANAKGDENQKKFKNLCSGGFLRKRTGYFTFFRCHGNDHTLLHFPQYLLKTCFETTDPWCGAPSRFLPFLKYCARAKTIRVANGVC